MATTNASDLIVPDVFADIVSAKFPGQLVLGQFATTDTTLEGQPGDTITFPKWAALTDMDELSEGTPIVPEKLDQTDAEATIKEFGKGVEVTDKAMLTGLGDPLDETAAQFSTLAARRVDASLFAAAVDTTSTSPLTLTTAAVLDWPTIVNGMAAFGDDAEPEDFDGLVIHSRQKADIMKDANFIEASKLLGAGEVVRRGQIGQLYGLNIFVSDRGPVIDTDPGAGVANRHQALILKKGALGLIYKRRPIVEKDRDILARTTVLTTNVHYATKRLDDKGVCVIRTTVGAIS